MLISPKDKETLRRLAAEKAAVAALPDQQRNIELWRRVNNLEAARPPLWINELPWGEMDGDGELASHCEGDLARQAETQLRRELHQWRHMPGNMVVEPVYYSPMSLKDSGFGIDQINSGVIHHGAVDSSAFTQLINDFKDVEKIKDPVVELDAEATEQRFHALSDAFGDLLPVVRRGVGMQWFTLWDNLIRWYGVERAMLDLLLNPDLVKACLQRLLDAFLARQRQYERLNLLERCDGNVRIGSGGLGYLDGLIKDGFDPAHVRAVDQWGCGNAQIFSEVSPEHHEEFSLQYERVWLKQFGLTYYGCCEQLHNKIHLLETIPNLRKISMSPWADVEKMVERTGGRYVLSYKVNPSYLAHDNWDKEIVRKHIVEVLRQTRGVPMEIIIKDVSTVRNQPRRVWEMAEVIMEETGELYA